jgi:hypothetical protein
METSSHVSFRSARRSNPDLTTSNILWDYPTMVLIADKKRRVVLPKTARPGDAYQCVPRGAGFVLEKLQPAPKAIPPVSKKKLNAKLLGGINLDEPAFAPIDDGSLD